MGRHTDLVRNLILVTLVIIVSPSQGQANQFSNYAGKLKQNFVNIDAVFLDCIDEQSGDINRGLGFIIGEDETNIFVATPWHVISRTKPVGTPEKPGERICRPDKILTKYHNVGNSQYIEIDFQKASLTGAHHKPQDDIDFLKLPKPKTRRSTAHYMRSSFPRGLDVSYIGYKGRPILPLGQGVILDNCEIELSQSCSVWVEGLETKRGESGATLIDNSGRLVGMITVNVEDRDIRALRIDAIRVAAEKISIPWNVYTSSEVTQLGDALMDAILNSDMRAATGIVDRYIHLDREFLNPESTYSELPINVAARKGQFDLVHKMIDRGATQASTAAIIALKAGDESVARKISMRGLNLTCVLFYSIAYDRKDVAQLLLVPEYADRLYDVNHLCRHDTTPLYEAIHKGYEDLAIDILKLGADPNRGEIDRVFLKGFPLSLAILKGQDRVVLELLHRDARVDVVSYEPGLRIKEFEGLGWAELFGPIHAAAAVGNIDLIDRLVDAGADPDVHETESQGSLVVGESPFEIALLRGQYSAAEHLVTKHEVSPLGYRYRDSLREDIRRVHKSGAALYMAERIIDRHKVAWCRNLQRADFEFVQDYYNQDSKCRD